MSWVSVHAFYHGELDALVTDGLRPLVDELAARSLIDGFFFLRYWDGGPHLRVRLSATAEEPVRDLALRRLRGYLAANPSKDRLDRYAERSAWLAAAEGVGDYLRTPMPNNTVHEIPYRPETERYGHGAAMSTVECHFVESSRIALGLLAARPTESQRQTAAFGAIALALSGRRPRPPEPDAELEARYLDTRSRLRALATHLAEISSGTSTLPATGALSAWWRTVSTLPDPRVADLCAHLFCNRLGVGIGQERFLRYAALRTLTGE